MKKIIQVLAAVAVISSATAFAADSGSAKFIAYYFHGNVRCVTCHKLENYSKEAIEDNFKDQITSGKLEFKEVNVEEKGNEHFMKDYQLFTKSLVLSSAKDGKEIKSKNLDKIWELVGNKNKFLEYVKSETSDFLKE